MEMFPHHVAINCHECDKTCKLVAFSGTVFYPAAILIIRSVEPAIF